MTEDRIRPIRVCNLIREAARQCEVSRADIVSGGKAHSPKVTEARRQVVRELANEGRYSTTTIGRWLNLHHTSVIYLRDSTGVSESPRPAVQFPATSSGITSDSQGGQE